MQNRDIVEVRYNKRYSKMGLDEIRLISFGVLDDRYPEEPGTHRGFPYFGFKRIMKLKGGLKIDMISQADLGIAIASAEKMFCMSAKSWINKFVKEIEKLPTVDEE